MMQELEVRCMFICINKLVLPCAAEANTILVAKVTTYLILYFSERLIYLSSFVESNHVN